MDCLDLIKKVGHMTLIAVIAGMYFNPKASIACIPLCTQKSYGKYRLRALPMKVIYKNVIIIVLKVI